MANKLLYAFLFFHLIGFSDIFSQNMNNHIITNSMISKKESCIQGKLPSIGMSLYNSKLYKIANEQLNISFPKPDNVKAGKYLKRAGSRFLSANVFIPLIFGGTYLLISDSSSQGSNQGPAALIAITGGVLSLCLNIGACIDLKRAGKQLSETPVRLY